MFLLKAGTEKYVWPGRRNSAWDGKYIGKATNIYDRRLWALWVALDICLAHQRMDGVHFMGSRQYLEWLSGVVVLATCN